MEEVGRKISYYRKKHKMSQEELGKRLGVTKSYISKLENAKTPISLETLNDLADIFNIHVRDFFEVEETEMDDVTFGYFKKQKDGVTEEDVKKAVEFVKDLKEGKFDLDKLKDINL